MNTAATLASTVAWGAFAIAFVLGAISARTQFCTLGAVSDIVNMGEWTRMRMWVLAMAVAILGAQGLYAAGLIDLSKAFYVRPAFTWLSYIVGGAMFGVGMTLASGCGSRTLVRIGGGNVKSVVVFVFMGIAAYMAMKGLFGVWRVNTLDAVQIDFAARGVATQELGAVLFGASAKQAQLACGTVIGLALLAFVLAGREFRSSADGWMGGLGYGLAVVAGWYLSAHLGFAENPDTLENTYFGTNSKAPESLTFVAPMAYSLELLMLWSDKSLIVTFGIATAAGMILGALAYSLAFRRFRWEGFASVADTRNHIAGAMLMGAGGVTAMGCTIGQGVTGLSTLALGSFLALGAMIAACWATLKYQYWRMMQEE
ncbi:MAG: YeeE/YedE family protein [Betaproteobacteria bacterium]|nr:YeeE/YedE family protein [Betaproteobacteria bacterium]